MKVGYLHIGSPEHGVSRYGYFLAAEAKRRLPLTVIEAQVLLSDDRQQNERSILEAAQQLGQADIVHLQFNKFNRGLWGGGLAQIHYLRLFMNACPAPLVVTLHDVFYPPYSLSRIWQFVRSKQQSPQSSAERSSSRPTASATSNSSDANRSTLQRGLGFLQSVLRGRFGADAIALQTLARRCERIFVCTQAEADRISDRVDRHKLQVIPHFVEERSIALDTETAKQKLGLAGNRVVTLLGFIYPPKGHHLLVEAMPHLPPDVMVVFAGGASSSTYEDYVQKLQATARSYGVEQRLRITGYLSESALELYLMATDLAVCPFTRFSASGSLSTWISVAKPILASDLPQIAEYNQLEPNAIDTFDLKDPMALATAIPQHLAQSGTAEAIAWLQQKLRISVIYDHHLAQYRAVLSEKVRSH
jgi:glycosyltransferase involved in cell wall biosynthesis